MTDKIVTLALDAMGGDHGPSVVIPAAIKALQTFPELHLILVGDESKLAGLLERRTSPDVENRISIHHASEVVAMDEAPSSALRGKKDSSMRVSINLVKEGRAQACVSAGNTGALMATSRFVLKTLPGVDRPAIVSILPSKKNDVHMLDLGANIDCTPEQLFQFAVMGSVLSEAVTGKARPTVGLLNIGEEEIKGNWQVKETAELLNKTKAINYVGFVEGNDIFNGTVDVVVCDGFVGNAVLKASEGLAKFMGEKMKEAFTANIFTKLCALAAMPILKKVKKQFDPSRYNGASFIGLNGIVIKSHGSANAKAFLAAIHEAVLEVEKNVPTLIRQQVGTLLEELY
jgi:glycerol-3-phosphate acyltransferase PlsX